MSNLDKWIEQAELAAAGELGAEDANALAQRIYGAFYGKQGWGRAGRYAIDKSWQSAIGAMMLYQDEQAHDIAKAAAAASNVSATASSESRAYASAYAEAVVGLEALDTLTDDDRTELEGLLQDVKSAKDETLFGHAVKKLVETAVEKGVETLPWVLPAVVEMAAKLTGAA